MNKLSCIITICLAAMLACGPNQPSVTDDAADDEAAPPTDTPCGGVDLMTDNNNCGECGNECGIWYEGLVWEAGACVEGKCGPGWTSCQAINPEQPETCADVCAKYDATCVPAGCAGVTGVLLNTSWFGYCNLELLDPVLTIASCDEEPVPYEDEEVFRQVACCCEGLD